MTTYDEAQTVASQHRAQFGDDVVRHDPEEWDGFLACEDCDWTVGFTPEADDYDWGDYDDAGWSEFG